MLAKLLTLAAALTSVVQAQPIQLYRRDSGFDYENDKVQGVNLGGWFLLEPYITPSLFECFDPNATPVDEYHYCQALGKDEAKKRLEDHWNTWITADDFATIKGWGMNHVRIPIGWWAFQESDTYVSGAAEYMDKAVGWANDNGLNVWVDLHGAPGGQNGFDNDGIRDQLEWQNGDNVDQTLNVLKTITERYGNKVAAIELVNEPLGPSLDMGKIKQFYQNAYDVVRKNHQNPIILHDAFQKIGYWNGFMDGGKYYNVALDHHQYQVFSGGELKRSIDDHVDSACTIGWNMRKESKWRITGEWSAAMTDCTKWLNGVGKGARYSGGLDGVQYIGDCSGTDQINTWSDDRKANTRRYIEAQLDAYEQGNGWFFWTYKTEGSLEWDASQLVENGLFPQPLNSRQYQNQCSY